MPPQRTFPSMKPLKTERTHEENQERAYIAASRRSDRSLEARVESARRASEIHKRRTGRSLRVTEQDVINEEMYEEEDDDIPSQYRRLTAHLQTGSAEFNRRLQTYLANHVAMRTALNDAIHNNFSQHYPNAPQFAHNTSAAYTSPLVTQGYAGTEAVRSPTSLSPSSSHAYRSAPYPMPGHAGFRGQTTQQQQQQQQNQIAARAFPLMPPQMQQSNPATPGVDITAEARRMSMPNPRVEQPDFKSLPEVATPLSDSADPTDIRCGGDYFDQNTAVECVSEVGTPAEQVLVSGMQPGKVTNIPPQNLYSPFSMALPTESQQMINRAALPQNSFGAALMDGSENWMFEASGLGASNPGEMLKADSHFHPSTAGMSSTLLQDYPEGADVSLAPGGADMTALGSLQGLDFGQFIDLGGSNSSNVPSGAGTPVSEHQVWQDLVDSTWVEEPNAS